jgi:hypothetical protein
MLSGSFPIFALSNLTTFSQTQAGATVPLNYLPSGYGCGHRFPLRGCYQTGSYRMAWAEELVGGGGGALLMGGGAGRRVCRRE